MLPQKQTKIALSPRMKIIEPMTPLETIDEKPSYVSKKVVKNESNIKVESPRKTQPIIKLERVRGNNNKLFIQKN